MEGLVMFNLGGMLAGMIAIVYALIRISAEVRQVAEMVKEVAGMSREILHRLPER